MRSIKRYREHVEMAMSRISTSVPGRDTTTTNAPLTAHACGRGGLRGARVVVVPGIRVWLRGCVALPFDFGWRDGRTEREGATEVPADCALHAILAVSVLGDVSHSPVRLSLGRDALVTVTMHVLFLTAEIPRAPWRY